MTAYWNKRLHAELAARGLTGEKKEYAIYGFTDGRTSSSKDMSDAEARELIARLPPPPKRAEEAMPPKEPKQAWTPPNPEAAPMRRYMLRLGMEKGKDFKFTKGWCEKQGVDGAKKKFNAYTVAELKKLSKIFKPINF